MQEERREAEIAIRQLDCCQEHTRLAALASYAILDTPSEPGYDAITHLAAKYFGADSACLGFADESRVWLKSWWGQNVREIPRKESIFNMVLAKDGLVVVPDVSKCPFIECHALIVRINHASFFASVPVRDPNGKILGSLTIFANEPHPGMTEDGLHMLESMAGLVASLLELRKLRGVATRSSRRRSPSTPSGHSPKTWPRCRDLSAARSITTSLSSTISPKSISSPAESSVSRLSFAGFIPSAASSRRWNSFPTPKNAA